MKKLLLISSIFIHSTILFAQNVGINNSGATPDASAMLDIASSSSGLLIPRVALTALNAAGPITSPLTSLLVYNTATAGTTPNNVTPGFYYWDGAKWVAFGGNGGKDWSLSGNAGTAVATNFLGTTDAVDFAIRTNNTERMRVLSTGQVAVNSTATFAASTLYSAGTGNNNAVDGNTAGTGYSINGQNTGTGIGVRGINTTATGLGVFGVNNNASGTGGLFAGQNTTAYSLVTGSGIASNGNATGLVAYGNTTATGWGINAAGNNGSTSTIAGGGGGSFSGNQWGVFAVATISGAGNNGTDRAAFVGNFVSAGATVSTVYVGGRIGSTIYKILGPGGASVSTTMPTRNGERILFAPEAPENWFFDIGEVVLVNGKATVTLDPTFVDCISDSKPFKVFVQGGENTMGSIRITRNQDEKTFIVEDLGGPSNGTVQYSVYAIWKTKENLRFPEFKPEYHQKTIIQEKVPVNQSTEINTTTKR